MVKSGVLFIISAPSGAGKTSLVKALLAQDPFKEVLSCVVTYTSRPPRQGEVNGQAYHFIQESVFIRLIEEGFFAEWSKAYGTYYGTPASIQEELAQGCSKVLIVDRAGARAIKQQVSDAVLIWITPPSIEALQERLQVRGTESEAQIQKRIALAREEMRQEAQNPLYEHIIVNDLFEISLNSLKKIVICSLDLKKIKAD